jgi:hypothetical protein
MSRQMKVAIGVVVTVVALAVAYLFVLKSSDRSTYYTYATYAEVERDTSVKGASVPPFVPRSARDITGWYDVDANAQALEFIFDQSDQAQLVSGFQQATGDEAKAVKRTLRGYSWKVAMPEDATLAAFTSHNAGVEYLVLDERNGRAYYATEPATK